MKTNTKRRLLAGLGAAAVVALSIYLGGYGVPPQVTKEILTPAVDAVVDALAEEAAPSPGSINSSAPTTVPRAWNIEKLRDVDAEYYRNLHREGLTPHTSHPTR